MELYSNALHLHNTIPIVNFTIHSAEQVLYGCLSNSYLIGKLPLVSLSCSKVMITECHLPSYIMAHIQDSPFLVVCS